MTHTPDPWPSEWEEARKQVNDLVNSEHGDVCDFFIVSLIHQPNGCHCIEVTGSALLDIDAAIGMLTKALEKAIASKVIHAN